MKKISLAILLIGLTGMITLSIIAVVDSKAEDITSAIIVQLLFAALFISGYISYERKQ